MFIDQVDKGFHILFLLEDGTSRRRISAAFAAVDGGVFLHQLSAVRLAVGAKQHCMAWAMHQEQDLRNLPLQFLCQIQQIIHREDIIRKGRIESHRNGIRGFRCFCRAPL